MFIYKPRTQSAFTLLFASVAYGLPAYGQSPSPNDEIVVTGSLLSASTHENLIGVSVLTDEELQRRISGSLGETLKQEPGISSSFFGVGASRPIIRGQGGSRVLLLDNGIGSIDASSASPDHAAAVEPAMATRIEVIRGSGLLRYGSSASGGVVNVIDGRIPEHVPDTPVIGNARIGLSSVDNGYETALGTDIALGELNTGNIVAHAEISHRKTEDYAIPDFARSKALRALEPRPANQEPKGKLSNSATQATSVAAGLSYIADSFFIGGAIKNSNKEYGVPGGEGARIELEQTRIDISSRLKFDKGIFQHLNISGGAADYLHSEIEPSGEVGTIFTNKGYEARAEIVQRPYGIWQAAHGIQIKKRDFSAIGEEAFVPPTTTNMFGIFSFHELDLDKLHLEFAGRYEHVQHTDDTQTDIGFSGASASFGIDYSFAENVRLGASLYRTERAPTSEELFSNGPHLATNQFEIGDPNLNMETAIGAELSLRYRTDDAHFTVNMFHTNYSNYIYETATGAIILTDEGDSLAVSTFIAADSIFKGFELEAAKELAIWKHWTLTADTSLEYVKATLSGVQTGPLPRIPPLGITAGLSAVSDMWDLRAELEYTAMQDRFTVSELATENYTLINAFASYQMNDNMTIRLSVHNLTNQDARQHTSFLKENVPLPGRNFKINLALSF